MSKLPKTITTIFTLMLFIFFVSNTLQARPARGGGQGKGPRMPDSDQIEQMVDDLAEAILLSEQQQTDVLKLYTDHFDEMKTAMESGQKDHEAMRQQHEEMREELETDIKALLTEEQQGQFDEFMKEQQQQRQRPPRQ